MCTFSFFCNDAATTEIYTLSLHDALPICANETAQAVDWFRKAAAQGYAPAEFQMGQLYDFGFAVERSEEHTSELQSLRHLVCRLLLEKKKTKESIETSSSNKAKSQLTSTT